MGKKREHMTVEQIKDFVKAEIPYVVGDGTRCIQAQARRMKELYKRHGHDVSKHVGVSPVTFGGGGGGDMRTRIGTPSRDTATLELPHFRGQRVA